MSEQPKNILVMGRVVPIQGITDERIQRETAEALRELADEISPYKKTSEAVPAEWIEAATRAFDDAPGEHEQMWGAAIQAVIPLIRAQALEEAAKICIGCSCNYAGCAHDECRERILALIEREKS